jgi:chromosome segregation ATPase
MPDATLTAGREESVRRLVSSGGDVFATDARLVLGELDRVRSELAALAAAHDTLASAARGGEDECRRLREDLATAEASLKIYRQRQQELWAEVDGLKQQAEAGAAWARASERMVLSLRTEVEGAQLELSRVDREHQVTLGRLEFERELRERTEAEAGRLRERVAELEGRRVEFVREPDDGEAFRLRQDNARLRQQAEAADRHADRTESGAASALASLQQEVDRLRQDNARLLSGLARAEARAEAAEGAAALALASRDKLAERVRLLGVA